MIDTEYLRVKQIDTGHELSLSRTQYDFAPDAYEVLEEAATDSGNSPLPPRYAGDPAPAESETAGYEDWKVDALKAEIDRRNADRDPDGDTYITPEAPGNKPELTAALEADDTTPKENS